MADELNHPALEQARKLVRDGDVVRDERDEWSAHEPSAEAQNRFIDREGWTAYAHWHLGVDPDASPETKGRFSFVYGDLTRVRRSAVIAIESRAAEYGHDEIAEAAKDLLAYIDEHTG